MIRPARIFAMLAALLLVAGAAWAHSAKIEVRRADAQITATCVYHDGSPMKAARVRVYDAAGRQLLEGKTDDAGSFTFKEPAPLTGVKIEVRDLLGHRAERVLQDTDANP